MDSAYTVVVHNRSERTAFIFNSVDAERHPARFDALFDEIASVCHRRWDGRMSAIAAFRDGSFSQDDWRYLESIDPDRIVSFSPLSEELIAEIDRRLCPEELRFIETFEKSDRIDVGMDGHGIEVSGVQAILKQFSADYFLSFQISKTCPREVRQFCWRNFGRDDVWSPTVFPTATPYEYSALRDVQKLTFGMEGREHLIDFLTKIVGDGRMHRRIMAPCQIGARTDSIPMPTGGLETAYQVIIGDSPLDLLEHWNGGSAKRNWYAPFRNQIWLPSALARDEGVMRAVALWSRANLDSWPGKPRKTIELISRSWSCEELKSLATFFHDEKEPAQVAIAVVMPEELQARTLKEVNRVLDMPRSFFEFQEHETVRLAGTRDKDAWEIPVPDILANLRTRSGSGSWCADVLVEQPAIADEWGLRQWWWLFPRKSCANKVHSIFHRAGRITREGYFALSFRYDSFREKKPTINVQRPKPSCISDFFFWPQSSENWGSAYDVRRARPPASTLVRYLRRSDKGEYLNGLISLFGNFETAREITCRLFWRSIFERLANRTREKDPVLVKDMGNVIRKVLGLAKSRDAQIAVAAQRVANLVGQRLAPKSLPLSELERRYEDYAAAAGALIGPPWHAPSSMERRRGPLWYHDMKGQLEILVRTDIVRLGISWKCERCGVTSWVHIDELKQHRACGGCDHEQALPGEPEWSYELNSLALRSVTSNQFAVLQALCQLAENSRHSFAYSTSTEIYIQNQKTPWHEIDLLCLSDGRLAVAEVKDTEIGFTDLEELADIAEALLADDALLFLPAQHLHRMDPNWKTAIADRLSRKHVRFDCVGLEQF